MPIYNFEKPRLKSDPTLAKKLDDAIRKKYPDSAEVAQVLTAAKSVDLACDKIAKASTKKSNS